MNEKQNAWGFRLIIMLLAWSLVGFLHSSAMADYAAAVLADEPLGYWRFSEPDGDLAANSGTAGAELNGEYIEAPRVAGPDLPGLGGGDNLAISVNADRAPSYVMVDASPLNDVEGEPGISFEGWVYAEERFDNRIGLWGQNDVPEFGFIQPFRIQFWSPGGGVVNWDFTEDDIEDETWFHVAATSNVDETILYINGEEVMIGGGCCTTDGTFGFSDFTFNIGGGGVYDPDGNQFDGRIDEVAIWVDKTLTPEQIKAHYDAAFMPIGGGTPGDYNGDGAVDLLDINLQAEAMNSANPDLSTFDENGDGVVDVADRTIWVNDHRNTWFGDSNLDGEFGSGDLVTVFTAGKFELDEPAGWEAGDWNGDMRFGSGDLVAAFTEGGFEMGPRPGAQAVPEPSTLAMLPMFLCGIFAAIRRRNQ